MGARGVDVVDNTSGCFALWKLLVGLVSVVRSPVIRAQLFLLTEPLLEQNILLLTRHVGFGER